jgi:hypothetical protein
MELHAFSGHKSSSQARRILLPTLGVAIQHRWHTYVKYPSWPLSFFFFLENYV